MSADAEALRALEESELADEDADPLAAEGGQGDPGGKGKGKGKGHGKGKGKGHGKHGDEECDSKDC